MMLVKEVQMLLQPPFQSMCIIVCIKELRTCGARQARTVGICLKVKLCSIMAGTKMALFKAITRAQGTLRMLVRETRIQQIYSA